MTRRAAYPRIVAGGTLREFRAILAKLEWGTPLPWYQPWVGPVLMREIAPGIYRPA